MGCDLILHLPQALGWRGSWTLSGGAKRGCSGSELSAMRGMPAGAGAFPITEGAAWPGEWEEWLRPPSPNLEPPPSFRAVLAEQRLGPTATICWKRSCASPSTAPGAQPSWACHRRFSLPEWQAGQRAGWAGAVEPVRTLGLSPTALDTDPASRGRRRCWAWSGRPRHPARHPPLAVTPVQVKVGGPERSPGEEVVSGTRPAAPSWVGAQGRRESQPSAQSRAEEAGGRS